MVQSRFLTKHFWNYHIHNMQNKILCQVSFNPHQVTLNIKNLGKPRKLEFLNVVTFLTYPRTAESEMKKIILVKSSLNEVKFNPRGVILPELYESKINSAKKVTSIIWQGDIEPPIDYPLLDI